MNQKSRFPILVTTLSATALLLATLAMRAVGSEGAAAAAATGTSAESPIALPRLEIAYSQQSGVRLSGQVPDAIEHDALLRRAQALYGADRVTDALRVGGVANPSWLSPRFLPDLRQASRAVAVLSDARLAIDAEAPNAAAQAALLRALAPMDGRGLTIEQRVSLKAL